MAEHKHPLWDNLFAGYVSGSRALTSGSYERLLYAAEIDGQLKIIAEYFIDVEALGVHWNHAQGARIDDLGEPVIVQRLIEPTRPEHHQDWNSM